MEFRKTVWSAVLGLAGIVSLLAFSAFGRETGEAFTVRFLDVGQGDAILLSQGSFQILVDGGRDEKRLLELLGAYMPLGDKTIEAVVTTHPDEDHIGGFSGIFDRYRVGTVLQTKEPGDSEAYARFEAGVKKANAIEAVAPTSVAFPNGARFEVVFPDESIDLEKHLPTNDTSVVARVSYGEHSFLLTGDFPDSQEGRVQFDTVETLKVSHHGSKNATTNAFLDATKPRFAVISVGKNRYGHPAPELLERLRAHGADILRTDEHGTISFVCPKEERCEVETER